MLLLKLNLNYSGWILRAILNEPISILLLCAKPLQSCTTLCDSMDCSPPGYSVQGILQARILEWVAISFSRGSSQPRDGTQVSLHLLHWQTGSLPLAPPGKPILLLTKIKSNTLKYANMYENSHRVRGKKVLN